MGQSLNFAPVGMSSERNPDIEKDKMNIIVATGQPPDHAGVGNVAASKGGDNSAANKFT